MERIEEVYDGDIVEIIVEEWCNGYQAKVIKIYSNNMIEVQFLKKQGRKMPQKIYTFHEGEYKLAEN